MKKSVLGCTTLGAMMARQYQMHNMVFMLTTPTCTLAIGELFCGGMRLILIPHITKAGLECRSSRQLSIYSDERLVFWMVTDFLDW